MLESVSRSACIPAPPDGSDAENVRTIGGNTGSESAGMAALRLAGGASLGRVVTLRILPHARARERARRAGSPAFREVQLAMKKYMCLICGWIYDEATGSPDDGIAPGTRWEDVPSNWTCPECGARKDDF